MAVAPEEIRFAVVLNGGVSLAVWMGGVALELDRLTREQNIYGRLLSLVGSTARVDVITGTSAGGINGAALALSQVNKTAELSNLRDLWVEQGRFEQLLRPPFSGQPMSLLQGDEFFLPKLHEAFKQLTNDFDAVETEERPIDLRITTTLLKGVPKTTYDDLGQQLTQTVHQGSFWFRRDPSDWARPPKEPQKVDAFEKGTLTKLVDRLALAARSTASFPFAFEPSFVRVGPTDAETEMGEAASWFRQGTDRTRFAVDGGVLVNTPTKEALEAIDRMPAEGLVRRVMLLVFPHAPAAGDEPPPDTRENQKSVVGGGGQLLSALYSQSGRTYVEKVEDHNRATASRRGGRNDLLNRLYPEDEPAEVGAVYELAGSLYSHYQDVRIRQAAREVTTRQLDAAEGAKGWSFERVRVAAEQAQRAWQPLPLPYVPTDRPPAFTYGPLGWPWGFTMAERLASAALDLLKRLVWVVKSDERCAAIRGARKRLHLARCEIRLLREEFDTSVSGTAPEKLDVAYWLGRLQKFQAAMFAGDNLSIGSRVRYQVDQIGRIVEEVRPILEELNATQEKMAGVRAWRVLLTPELQDGEGGDWREVWVSRLLALEISATCLTDGDPTPFDQPVELAQVSLQTRNAFAKQTITPDDKAGGASLARFSGFLKRSWRVNDWTWGRLDAATMLCRIVLDPERLHRQDKLRSPSGLSARRRAGIAVYQLVNDMFGARPAVPEIRRLILDAIDELTRIYSAQSTQDLEPSATALAELAAWGLHVRIIVEELPALCAAILADANEGANPRSRGELFLAQYANLLEGLPTPEALEKDLVANVPKALAALEAFDRAGIGRENLVDEVSSDQMIRTAATAAATAVTVLDSDKSGLGVAKPVTRALRGGALLPYWVITGLTKGSRIAQGLAVLAGTLGIAMLVLAVFTLLPTWAIAPAATAGAGLLLGMFGYAALRSGTMLHGLVLLTPMIPLGVYAVDRWVHADAAAKEKASAAVVGLGGVLVMTIILILLGSIPVVRKTPLALVVDTAVWFRRAAVRLGKAAVRFGTAVARRSWDIAAVVLGVVIVGMLAVSTGITALLAKIPWSPWLLLIVVVLALRVAQLQGRSLKVWLANGDAWDLGRAEHPAAAVAGWAAVYGGGYLAFGLWVSGVEFSTRVDQSGWLKSGIVASAFAMAAVLLLISTWLAPVRARRRIRRTLLGEASRALYPADTGYAESLVKRLTSCGLLCSYLVGPAPGGLVLRSPGQRIADEIKQKLDALPQ